MLTAVVISSCALWGSALLPWPRFDHCRVDSVETEHQAAQIALLVLRTTVEGAASTRRFYILPSRAPLSGDQAARELAMLKKPVKCSGGMEGLVLEIECQQLNGPEVLEHHRQAVGLITGFAADVRKQCPGSIREARLLLRGRGASVTAPLRALAAWLRDYDMPFSLGGAGRTAELPRELCMVFEVGPPGTMKIQTDQTGPVRS
jgi:hypothetical protein